MFNISGTGVHTILPNAGLPQITEQVTINGYSQPGSQVNTAVAPNPLNGTITIEIDGSNAGTNVDVFHFDTGSEDSQIKGLVIGNFSESSAIIIGASGITVQGNYIGTNPAGTAAKPNEIGLTNTGTGTSQGALIGGLNPAERNIISGNTDGSTASAAYPSTDWVIQGNYIGVGADGVTAIPNATTSGSGALSIDDCSDVLVGGDQVGAANVISGNLSYGIAPDNSPGLHVAGNYIGTDYTGTQAVPNLMGIIISDDQQGTVIGGPTSAERNIISGNTIAGVLTASSTGVIQVSGNYIGLKKTGVAALPNGTGMIIADDALVGGSVAKRNVISGNTIFNISVQGGQVPASGAEVSGNYIGTNAAGDIDPAITSLQGEGVRISGNTSENLIGGEDGNIIAGNRGAGVSVRSWSITQFGVTATPTKSAILGNQIFENEAGGLLTGSPGLGIDLYRATVATVGGFPVDLQADSYVGLGVNANDASDSDTGPNNYINFPVLNSVKQDGGEATINYSLDAADSPTNQYRIEFFGNDEADPSGYGEGQTFLGAITSENGNSQQTSLALPSGYSLEGKYVSATTTAIDSSTDSGFGSTSEFSRVVQLEDETEGESLASTGQSTTLIFIAALSAATLGSAVLIRRFKS